MEKIVENSGFEHIGAQIFWLLDNKSLCYCRQVKRSWKYLIDQQKFLYYRQLDNLRKFCSGEIWTNIFKCFMRLKSIYDLETCIKVITESHKLSDPIASGNLENVTFLIPLMIQNGMKMDVEQSFVAACRMGNYSIVCCIAEMSEDFDLKLNKEAFFEACFYGHEDIVLYLLSIRKSKQIDINITDEMGTTCLIWALKHGYLKIAENLIKCDDCDLNSAENYFCGNWTPLHYACFYGYEDIVELLLQQKGRINLDHRDAKERTALDIAKKQGYMYKKIVQKLQIHYA